MAHMIFTILGCGSSPGVPRIGNDWGCCDPNEPKNRRLRCSLLVERVSDSGAKTTVLVDASPDLRFQMLREGVERLDGVLFTHAHADHTHGIDDLRQFWIKQRQRIDTYADAPTAARLHEAFGYCYTTPPGSSYPPILNDHRIKAHQEISIDGPGGLVTALPYIQKHGDITSLGFRFNKLAYSSDINGLYKESYYLLENLEVWIVGALRDKPHPSHFSLEETLEANNLIKPQRAILTHMHIDLDYQSLKMKLPRHVEPAFDGMRIIIPEK